MDCRNNAQMARSWASVVRGKEVEKKVVEQPPAPPVKKTRVVDGTSWAAIAATKPAPKPAPKPATKPATKPAPKKWKKLTPQQLAELYRWAAEQDGGGCSDHDRIGCAECAFNASDECYSSRHEYDGGTGW